MKFLDYIAGANQIQKENLKELNIAILRSFTCETVESILKVKLAESGFYANLSFGGYNQFFSECIDTDAFIYKIKMDMIILAIRIEDFFPIAFEEPEKDFTDEIILQLKDCIINIRKNSNAYIIIHNFVKPYYASKNLLQSQGLAGINNVIRQANIKIVKMISEFDGIFVFDTEELILNLGTNRSYDLVMWDAAKNPYTFDFYEEYANLICRFVHGIYGTRKKCIVLDLDNTLWEGILGEDGIKGIRIFTDMQNQLLYLRKLGILLAINSKNNESDVFEVFDKHEDMRLKKDDFSALEINWDDKASNMKKIARKLNIGLESMIFIDDSKVECQLIETYLPQVTVVNLPENSLLYPEIINNLPCLDILKLTQEDLNKTELYKKEDERQKLRETMSIDDYLKSLDMKATINSIDEFNITRAVALTQKTNQFNLTTRRYTEKDIREMLENGCQIFSLSLLDRFGDNGTTGLMIINTKQDWQIDTFLLSCRIMGRSVENAFMEFVVRKAAKLGVGKIKAEYIETAKNAPVKELYKNMGFYHDKGLWHIETSQTFQLKHFVSVIDNTDKRVKP